MGNLDKLFSVSKRQTDELAENGIIEAEDYVNVPLEEVIAPLGQRPSPDQQSVVYCGSGHRSIIGMSILRAYGYENVRSLVGGVGAWVDSGFPVVEYAGS